jgi:hypothetical protein
MIIKTEDFELENIQKKVERLILESKEILSAKETAEIASCLVKISKGI